MDRPTARTCLVALLLVAGTVGWRRGEYFSGSLDPVVLAKALVVGGAVVLALLAPLPAGGRRLGSGSSWFLAAMLLASLIGAFASGSLVAGAVVAARVVLLAAALVFLLRRNPAGEVLVALVGACLVVATVAGVTGLRAEDQERLRGGIPPVSPNELALLAGIVVIWVGWRVLAGEARWWEWAAAGWSLALVWLSGSRTGLLMLVLGLVVMVLCTRRFKPGLVVGGLVAVAVGALAVTWSGVLVSFAERGGDGTSTLDSRFIAWRAAAHWADSTWEVLFGGGLSVKIIPIAGQWWDTQPLDSSWVSALVQAGLVGIATALCWVVWVFRGAVRAPAHHRVLFAGMLVFLVGRSTVESGLFDATPAFLLLMTISLLVEGGSRGRLAEETAEETAEEAGEPTPAPATADPVLPAPR